jgi:hypothetical protein
MIPVRLQFRPNALPAGRQVHWPMKVRSNEPRHIGIQLLNPLYIKTIGSHSVHRILVSDLSASSCNGCRLQTATSFVER